MRPRQDAPLEQALDVLELVLKAAAIDEFEQSKSVIVRQREHRAERRFEPLGIQTGGVPGATGRGADEAIEGAAEPAAGLEALVELQFDYGFSLAYAGQRQAHSPRAMIGVEGHTAITLERAPRSRG